MKAILLASSFLLLLYVPLWVMGFRLNATASMPVGVYRLEDDRLERGDMVSFCLESELAALALERSYLRPGLCPSGVQPLLKRVVGLPGDRLAFGSEGVRIDGRLQPSSSIAARDNLGRATPPPVLESGVIPAGKALLLSDNHAGGFDSRYFGLVPLAALRRARPILIFNTQGD